MSRNDIATFIISGVCCASEETVLRKVLDSSIGKRSYRFNLVTCELRVEPPVAESAVLRELRRAGFDGRRKEIPVVARSFLRQHAEALTTGCAALLAVAGLAAEGTAAPLLQVAAIALGGWRIFRRAFGALRTGALDMNVLMSVAVVGAMAIGKWGEGAAVIVLFAVSLLLESYSSERTRRALRSLMDLSPGHAAVIRKGREETLPLEDIVPGDIVVIRPGERNPVDGVVTEGASTVNEAPVTGESLPVSKMIGSHVYAGTLNGYGVIRVRVVTRAGDSTIARILRMVEDAQERRAPVERLVDRFARMYTPVVLVLALFVAVVPPLLLGGNAGEWFYRSLVLLVIACPCALVISTPVALVSAMTRAARTGVLIKGGAHVESLARVSVVALDKTGTLTLGMPRVTDVVPLDSTSRAELMTRVAALEQRSEHHLASGALLAAGDDLVRYDAVMVDAFEAMPGKGLRGRIDGTMYYLGNLALSRETGFCTPVVEEKCAEFSSQGKTAVVLGTRRHALGVVAFRDGVRNQGRAAIAQLRAVGIARTVMLTGDNRAVASKIAAELGIDDVRADLLPHQKVAAVEELKRSFGNVAMVGDGINDAPALAVSSVGIAMGVAGSDAALETADVVLMSDNLAHLPYVFGLSRATLRIIRQNIALAVLVKLVFFALTLSGWATLWMAVLADDGAALAVIFNAMRVLAYRGGER